MDPPPGLHTNIRHANASASAVNTSTTTHITPGNAPAHVARPRDAPAEMQHRKLPRPSGRPAIPRTVFPRHHQLMTPRPSSPLAASCVNASPATDGAPIQAAITSAANRRGKPSANSSAAVAVRSQRPAASWGMATPWRTLNLPCKTNRKVDRTGLKISFRPNS